MTPERAASWLPWSAAAASMISLGIIAVHAVVQKHTDVSQMALNWTLAALIPSLVVAFAPAPAPPVTARNRRGATVWLLAFNAGILLLTVPAFLAVWQTDWDRITGWRTYAFFNKRWLAALYAVGLATFIVLPVWFARWLDAPTAHARVGEPAPRPRVWWRWVLLAVECALLLAGVWYLVGPPWHVGTHHRPIDLHEQVHLGPLQAIARGFIPYVGPASTQYGPGFQATVYSYMTWTGQFNLVGFREAFLAIHLVCFGVFALLARAFTGAQTAWAIVVAGIICSPLKFFVFMGDGTPGDNFGWGNATRYLGPLVVVPILAILATRAIPRARALAVALGVVWGVLAWGSQESLATVITSGTLLLAILVGAGATSIRTVTPLLVRLGAGFLALWIPLLGWYALQGQALAFVDNYLLVPRAVAAGFSNTWWSDGPDSPLTRAFHYTPLVIIVAAVMTLWDVRGWRLRRALDRDQIRFLSFLSVLAACYQSSLFRSDALHLLNTFLALPFVLVLALRDVPGWIAPSWPGRLVARSAMAAVFVWIYPLTPQLTNLYDWVLYPPQYKYSTEARAQPSRVEQGVAFERATPGLQDEPHVVGTNTGPMRDFLRDASRLHDLIGARPTFVHSAQPYFTGLVYFMADITPAPFLYDSETMLLNDRLQQRAWKYFQQHLSEVECVVVSSTGGLEAQMFLTANPAARVVPFKLGEANLFVILV